MPANSTGTITVTVDVNDKAAYSYSLQDDIAICSDIPTGGTTLTLPSTHNTGDEYGYADGDGSASSGNPITIAAPAGTTIQGGASIALTAAFGAGRVRFDASSASWIVVESTTGSSGSGVTWADDLAGSSNAAQRVQTLSGATLIKGLNESNSGATSFAIGTEPTSPSTAAGLWLFAMPAGGTASDTNYALLQDGSTLHISSATGGVSIEHDASLIAFFAAANVSILPPLFGGQSGSPLLFGDSALTLQNGATTNLTALEQQTPSLTIAAINLSGATTLNFGNLGGAAGTSAAIFDLDCTNLVTSGHTFTLTNGTASLNIAPYFAGTNGLLLFRVKLQTNYIAVGGGTNP